MNEYAEMEVYIQYGHGSMCVNMWILLFVYFVVEYASMEVKC